MGIVKLIFVLIAVLMFGGEALSHTGWFPLLLISCPWIIAALTVVVIMVRDTRKAWANIDKSARRAGKGGNRGRPNGAKSALLDMLCRKWTYVESGCDVMRRACLIAEYHASRVVAFVFRASIWVFAVGGALVALQMLKSRLVKCDWNAMSAFVQDGVGQMQGIESCECWKENWPTLLVLVGVVACACRILFLMTFHGVRRLLRWQGLQIRGKGISCKCESDRPLEEGDVDRLSRNAYVKTIASLLRGAIRDEPQYIGLYGRWGEGKTSILSLLRKEVRYEGFAFVDFRLWEYADRKELPRLLFDQIAQQEKLRTDTSLAGLIRSFGRALMLDRVDNVLGAVPIVGPLLAEWHKSAFGLDAIRDSLREALTRHNERIVIVLDDLDRLLAADIYELLRLIKANGDLPNVSYLVLADREYLAASIAEMLPTVGGEIDQRDLGRRYLEKIIPLECNMPPIRGNRYVRLFRELLKDQIDGIPDNFMIDSNPFENIAGYLQTMRNVKSLVNAIKVQWTYRRSLAEGLPKIHFGDMADLIAVRMFDRAFYDALVENFYSIRAQVNGKSRSGNDGFSRKWVEDVLLTNTPKERHAHLIKFLDAVMNFKEVKLRFADGPGGDGDGRFYYELPTPEDIAGFRLCGQDAFDNYILIGNENTPSAKPLSQQFFDSLTMRGDQYAGDFLVGVWREDGEKLNRILRDVRRMCTVSKQQVSVMNVCRALSWTAETIAMQGGRKDFEFNLVNSKNLGSTTLAQIVFCIRSLTLIDFSNCRRLQAKLMDYWMRNNLLIVAAREIGMYNRTNAFDVEVPKMRELMKFVARKIGDLNDRGRLRDGAEELALRRALAVASRYDSEIARACARMVEDDMLTYPWCFHALAAFALPSKRLKKLHGVLLDGRLLFEIFTCEDLEVLWERVRLQRCTQAYERAMVCAIRFLIARRRQGLAFNEDDLETALLDEMTV